MGKQKSNRVRFFVDECLSPSLAHHLAAQGFDAICARDMGRAGEPDHVVLRRCVEEDRVLVTHNAGDFRKLVGHEEIHPGLIILAESSKEGSQQQLMAALVHSEARANPSVRDWMVNRVVEVDTLGNVTDYELPASGD